MPCNIEIVFIECIALNDLSFQAMNPKVHSSKLDIEVCFFLAVERDLIAGVFSLSLYKMTRLNEHACRSTGNITNRTVIWLYHIDYHLHKRYRCEKLSPFLSTRHL